MIIERAKCERAKSDELECSRDLQMANLVLSGTNLKVRISKSRRVSAIIVTETGIKVIIEPRH